MSDYTELLERLDTHGKAIRSLLFPWDCQSPRELMCRDAAEAIRELEAQVKELAKEGNK